MNCLSLGYSPCPNDTFVFYALVHKRIEIGELDFREVLKDVETLNQMAVRSELDITKISYHAFGNLREDHCLIRSGGALGKGCGPLVVAREKSGIEDLTGRTIAIPGKLTTAYLLLLILKPSFAGNIIEMPFNRIIDAVKKGEADAGLIIHESRFTYQQAGLKQVIDLGEWWEEKTGLPIPLGGIIAKRSLGKNIILNIETLLRESVNYAFKHREETKAYIKRHSQEIADDVIEKHINLYVNNYTIDIGGDGMQAVQTLLSMAEAKGIIRKSSKPLFID